MPRTRTPRQWREILDAFEHSNLSQAEFCRSRGLSPAIFRYHRVRAAAQGSAKPPRLVELFTELTSETPPEALCLELHFALGLATIHGHPAGGHLFVFCNAARTRIKVLTWDGSGLWLCNKRLEQGRFRWDWDVSQTSATIPHEQLAMLLSGLDLKEAKPRRWYRKSNLREDEPVLTKMPMAS